MIYLVSDSHLGHTKLADANFTPNPRPKDFTERVLVGLLRYGFKENSLIHLGDLLLSPKEKRKSLYDDLAYAIKGYGHRTLIKGNHDKQSNAFYRSLGFDAVVDGALKLNCGLLLSHAAIPGAKCINLHGHTHGRFTKTNPYKFNGSHWMYDLTPEVVGYEPWCLDEYFKLRERDITEKTKPTNDI